MDVEKGPGSAMETDITIDAKVTSGKIEKSKPGRSAPVLPWMRVPLTIHPGDGTLLEDVGAIDPRLIAALASLNIEVLFPVQSVVWEATAGGSSSLHDICLASPTGSGKTLAYSLPVLQALARSSSFPSPSASTKSSCSLQALIVLPTRDLALQVYSVISPLCKAIGFPCCAACGKAGLAAEAEALVSKNGAAPPSLVVATPGRLIAHLEGTPGFNLHNLRFLVVDEADRLLRQTYQNWLPRVLSNINTQNSSSTAAAAAAVSSPSLINTNQQSTRRVVKFIVSATLTKDPSKMDRLGLYCPRYIAMAAEDYRHKLPSGLEELKCVVPAEKKPFALAALLAELTPKPTIVFISAVDSTHRVALLLKYLKKEVGTAVEYSSKVPPEERRNALTKFRAGHASILVCSDAMTRGMDVEGVEAVINYDAPVYVKTYVHRAGRTARAGKTGKVITLLRNEDVKHFKSMLRKADNTYVKDTRIERELMEEVKIPVEKALAKLLETLGGGGDLGIDEEDKVEEAENRKVGRLNQEEGVKHVKRRKITGVPELKLI
jgi:ATP-dependent RNA helicase DDX51/DBP6